MHKELPISKEKAALLRSFERWLNELLANRKSGFFTKEVEKGGHIFGKNNNTADSLLRISTIALSSAKATLFGWMAIFVSHRTLPSKKYMPQIDKRANIDFFKIAQIFEDRLSVGQWNELQHKTPRKTLEALQDIYSIDFWAYWPKPFDEKIEKHRLMPVKMAAGLKKSPHVDYVFEAFATAIDGVKPIWYCIDADTEKETLLLTMHVTKKVSILVSKSYGEKGALPYSEVSHFKKQNSIWVLKSKKTITGEVAS